MIDGEPSLEKHWGSYWFLLLRPTIQPRSSSLSYAINHLPIPPSHLIARISFANTPSIRLFQSLGFAIVKIVEVWGEVEIRFG